MLAGSDTLDFSKLFQSNESAYGVTVVGEIENGKAQSKSTLKPGIPGPSVVDSHLAGNVSIGMSPLRENSKLYWGAIDIDSYLGNIYDIVEAIWDYNLPLVPCLSKSKKLHIYIFFAEETEPEQCIELLRAYAALFRCDEKTEIFPKQTKITSSLKFPSWINLPYFDCENPNNWRKEVRKQGEYLDIHEFLNDAKSKKLTYEQHWEAFHSLPYDGAPPCIQSGVVLRDIAPGQRNQWFYNVACYLRMMDEDVELEEPLLELNESLHQPLPEREITTTVSKVKAKTCYYQCQGMVGCNKKVCRTTDKGIGNDKDSAGISFGQLTQVLTDPPYWTWEVNNVLMTFNSTDDLLNQTSFRRQCTEKLHHAPNKVKDERWTKIINRALENLQEMQVDIGSGFGAGSMFMDALTTYFTDKMMYTDKKILCAIGKIFVTDTDYVFHAMQFRKYLRETRRIFDIPDNEIQQRLLTLGARVDNGYWYLPKASVPTGVSDEEIIANIEFKAPETNAKTEVAEEEYGF